MTNEEMFCDNGCGRPAVSERFDEAWFKDGELYEMVLLICGYDDCVDSEIGAGP